MVEKLIFFALSLLTVYAYTSLQFSKTAWPNYYRRLIMMGVASGKSAPEFEAARCAWIAGMWAFVVAFVGFALVFTGYELWALLVGPLAGVVTGEVTYRLLVRKAE